MLKMNLLLLFLFLCLTESRSNHRCGQKKEYPQTTIVGGEEADKNEFPWTALLRLHSTESNHSSTCAGALINHRYVVTAAHCLKEIELVNSVVKYVYDNITIVLGEHDTSQDSETELFITRASRILVHPKYSNRRSLGLIRYDVGLLELETPVDLDKFPHINPICLPEQEDLELDLSDRTGLVAGWGATVVSYVQTHCDYTRGVTHPASTSHTLRKIEDLRFLSLQECNSTFHELFLPSCPSARVSSSDPVHLCASSHLSDICSGDSGAGLVTLDSSAKRYFLAGITSFNLGCNSSTSWGEDLPSVFTNIREQSILQWIRDNTHDSGFVLPGLTMDAETYAECSSCDARADRAGNRVVAKALRDFLARNHVQLAIAGGDVEVSRQFGNERIDTGHSCSRTAEARDIRVTARMVNNEEILDAMSVDYLDEIKNAFIAGDVPHEVSVSASIRTWFGTKLWFGKCKNVGRKTCATQASARGVNKILVSLTASSISTATIAGQEYLQFVLDVSVLDETDPATYSTLSAPKGSGCNLDILGIKIGSINTIVQKYANSYLQSETSKINELRGPVLVSKLESVLKARLGSTVSLPVNVVGGGRRKRETFPACSRRKCPPGFTRIANSLRCQKTFGTERPSDCSQYGAGASEFSSKIAGGKITVYQCHVDMV